MGLTLGVLHEAVVAYHEVSKNYRRQVAYCEMGPIVYFDIGTRVGPPLGRVIVHLQHNAQPQLAAHFLKLCTGECPGTNEKPLTYEQSRVCAIDTRNKALLVGCVETGLPTFTSPMLGAIAERSARPGGPPLPGGSLVLLPFPFDPDCFSSLFYFHIGSATEITDGKVIGRIVEGRALLESLLEFGTDSGIPSKELLVHKCGQL